MISPVLFAGCKPEVAAFDGRVIAVLTGAGDRSTLAPLADVVLESVQELLCAG